MQIFERHAALSSEAPVYRKLFKSALVESASLTLESKFTIVWLVGLGHHLV